VLPAGVRLTEAKKSMVERLCTLDTSEKGLAAPTRAGLAACIWCKGEGDVRRREAGEYVPGLLTVISGRLRPEESGCGCVCAGVEEESGVVMAGPPGCAVARGECVEGDTAEANDADRAGGLVKDCACERGGGSMEGVASGEDTEDALLGGEAGTGASSERNWVAGPPARVEKVGDAREEVPRGAVAAGVLATDVMAAGVAVSG
jgi:hypothetical protein